MTPERWQQVKEIVSAASELPSSAQSSYLRKVSNGDASLREEAESLLSQLQGSEFLNSGSLMIEDGILPSEESWTGRLLGTYKLLDEIGHGGMGTVYRAIRADDQYEKQVAIKLVRSGLDSGFFLSRFRNERQILASLEHPNIARLLDGGTTDNGFPYLVMEYVEGEPLDIYCDRRQLPIRERLELFRAVCSAVQYAHQRLVVHRDIKPGNILVTADGLPKLVDFGIAKIVDPGATPEAGPSSHTLLPMMTPEYASPEQVRGGAITTATDMYSLGVVLYELLTGRRPYRLASWSPLEVAKAVCEQEPERPSSAVTRGEKASALESQEPAPDLKKISQARGLEPHKLARLLRSDLDAIVLKALRKEPRQRYSTVEQLSGDLSRYAAGLPVLAHKGTRTYRTQKLLRRHRAGVVVVSAMLAFSIAGVAAIVREARIAQTQRARAERRYTDVRKLASSLVFGLHDAIQNLPGATPARKLLVEDALVYLDRLSTEGGEDPQLQFELASAYLRMGDVQGNPYESNLGDIQGALRSYRKGVTILESLAASDPRNMAWQRALSGAYLKLGEGLEPTGRPAEALAIYHKSQAIAEKLAARSVDPEDAERLAGTYYTVARALQQSGDSRGALANLERSATIRESITGNTDGHTASIRRKLAGVYGDQAEVLMGLGQRDRALERQKQALAIMQQLAQTGPDQTINQRFLAQAYYYWGLLLEKVGRVSEALQNYALSREILEHYVQHDPQDVSSKRELGLTFVHIGTAEVAAGHARDGLKSILHGNALIKSLPEEGGRNDYILSAFAESYLGYGKARMALARSQKLTPKERANEWQEARVWFNKSLEIWQDMKIHGALFGSDREKLEESQQGVTACDAMLGRVSKTGHLN